MRIGIGYDVHPFKKGRKLLMGGIEIKYKRGLEGHSDADVLLHAVCDAILGALGRGDIGMHFPDTREEYKGISSVRLLEKVVHLMEQEKYEVNNLDTIILAEEPKFAPYIPMMRKKISAILDAHEKDINIKATTNERMGWVGRKEGIAAWASVLLIKKER